MMKYLLLLVLAGGLVFAQYNVKKRTLNEGGTKSAGSSYGVKGSAGQNAVGKSSGSQYQVGSGFWYSVSNIDAPTVLTTGITAITSGGADGEGEITATGGEDASRRGFFYKVYDGTGNSQADSYYDESGTYGTGDFSTELTLDPETRYTAAAFAENGGGIALGSSLDFWTLSLEPGSHAISFAVDSVLNTTSVRLAFSPANLIANCDGYIVLARKNNMPVVMPQDGNGYSLGSSIGSSKVVAIVTNTADATAIATGLGENSNYYFVLIPFNYNGTDWATANYYTDPVIPNATAATPIPTLTEWAIMSLLLAMAGFGIFKLKTV